MLKSGQSYSQALGKLRRARINQWPIPFEEVAGIEKAVRDRVNEAVAEKVRAKSRIAGIVQIFEDLQSILSIKSKDDSGADRPKDKVASEIVARVQYLVDLSTDTEKS